MQKTLLVFDGYRLKDEQYEQIVSARLKATRITNRPVSSIP
jgi:hypothetical protein